MLHVRPEIRYAQKGDPVKVTLTDIHRLRDLRLMLRNSHREIVRLKKLPAFLRGDQEEETMIAEKIRQEARDLERRILESEMGFHERNEPHETIS